MISATAGLSETIHHYYSLGLLAGEVVGGLRILMGLRVHKAAVATTTMTARSRVDLIRTINYRPKVPVSRGYLHWTYWEIHSIAFTHL